MRLQLSLIVGILGISIQAVAANRAPNPAPPAANAPYPGAKNNAPSALAQPSLGSQLVVSNQAPSAVPTNTPLPVAPQPVKVQVPHIVVPTPTATPIADSPHPGAKNYAPSESAQPKLGSQLVASNQAPTATPTLIQGVTVWPSISKGGHCILFKAPADPGTPIQLSIQTLAGGEVFKTVFSGKSRSGGYVWRLQGLSGSPVAGGEYGYVLRFQQQGQNVTAQGKVTVVR